MAYYRYVDSNGDDVSRERAIEILRSQEARICHTGICVNCYPGRVSTWVGYHNTLGNIQIETSGYGLVESQQASRISAALGEAAALAKEAESI